MELSHVQNKLGYEFKDSDLLLEALTHSSCSNEPAMGLKKHNESLAWLGDALIHWVVSEKVYRKALSPEDMHNLRAGFIGKSYLAELAVDYGLDNALIMSEGEEKKDGRCNEKNLHTAIEAVVGAIVKDKGYSQAKNFVLQSTLTARDRDI